MCHFLFLYLMSSHFSKMVVDRAQRIGMSVHYAWKKVSSVVKSLLVDLTQEEWSITITEVHSYQFYRRYIIAKNLWAAYIYFTYELQYRRKNNILSEWIWIYAWKKLWEAACMYRIMMMELNPNELDIIVGNLECIISVQ